MKKVLKLLSPAKINLRLDVLGKREDRYHEIESLMTRVSLYDEVLLSMEKGNGIDVICSETAPSGEGNIAYKAAMALLGRDKSRFRLKIGIKKRIPVAAGLGGGSSNAAAVLMGLNEMLGAGLSRDELIRTGISLGADVPFFIFEGAAIAKGIGDILEAVELPVSWLVLVNPGIPVSTADVYNALGLKIGLTKRRFDISISNPNRVEDIVRLLHNDLEGAALKMHPEIGVVKNAVLAAGAAGALMSGSGATVFGIFENREGAEKAFASLSSEHKDWRSFLVKTI